MAKQVESGTKLGNAIANTIKWIDARNEGKKWDKGAFGKYMNDTYTMKLNDGRTVEVVRDDTKETAQLINGFYSDIEQKLLDTKKQSGSANEWKSIVGEGDESKFTGLIDWLSNQQGSVSKTDIQKYLKDNRIEVVEVVKDMSEAKMITSDEENYLTDTLMDDYDYLGMASVFEAKEAIVNNENWVEKYNITDKKLIKIGNKYRNSINAKKGGIPKFETYQLEGEKENYKEVLVTMPSKSKRAKLIKSLEEKYNKTWGRTLLKEITAEERESVDKLQDDSEYFKSQHFDEPNILVHLRMNTRTDAEGNKVLFLEEIQSDWGQEGKKKGFKKDEVQIEKELDKINQDVYDYVELLKDKYGFRRESVLEDFATSEELSKYKELKEKQYNAISTLEAGITPSAPFVTDTNAWTKLGLKVALKEAVKQGAQMQRKAFEKLVDEKMDWVEARMKKLGKLEVKCP
jgi:hypothetical protein